MSGKMQTLRLLNEVETENEADATEGGPYKGDLSLQAMLEKLSWVPQLSLENDCYDQLSVLHQLQRGGGGLDDPPRTYPPPPKGGVKHK